jgi:DNA-binding transcriptional regulator GbsR (MarR family)
MDASCHCFVDRLGLHAEADGLPRIAGRLFGTLLLSPEPRCLDDLAAELGVSKASVSTDCRRLHERGIVERVPMPGDRRDFYRLAPDFLAQIVRHSSRRWAALQELVASFAAAEADTPATVRERLEYVDALSAFLRERMDVALREWADGARRQREAPAAAVIAGAAAPTPRPPARA